MRGTPTRLPYSPQHSRPMDWPPSRSSLVSWSESNDSATAQRAPSLHRSGARRRPARTWFTSFRHCSSGHCQGSSAARLLAIDVSSGCRREGGNKPPSASATSLFGVRIAISHAPPRWRAGRALTWRPMTRHPSCLLAAGAAILSAGWSRSPSGIRRRSRRSTRRSDRLRPAVLGYAHVARSPFLRRPPNERRSGRGVDRHSQGLSPAPGCPPPPDDRVGGALSVRQASVEAVQCCLYNPVAPDGHCQVETSPVSCITVAGSPNCCCTQARNSVSRRRGATIVYL